MNIIVLQYVYNGAIFSEFYDGEGFTFRINNAKRYEPKIPLQERRKIKKLAKGYNDAILTMQEIKEEDEVKIKTYFIKKL